MGKILLLLMSLLASLTVFEEMSYGSSEESVKSNVIKGLQLIVSFDSVVRSVNEPVWVKLEICNISSEEKDFFYVSAGYDFHLEITRIKDDSHEPVLMTEYGSKHLDKTKGVVSIRSEKIAPGKSHSVEMNLSRLFDLSCAGTYYLSVKRTVKTGSRKWEDLQVEKASFTLKSKVKTAKTVGRDEEKESGSSDKEPEKPEPEKQANEEKESAVSEKNSGKQAQEKQEKTAPPEIPKDEKPEKIEKKEEPVEEAFPWYLVAIVEAVIIGALALIVIKRGRK